MSTPIRIKDNVYSRLEMNVKGYESISDTINRSIHALEVLEALEMIRSQIISSIDMLTSEGIEREKILLVHYSDEAKLKAIAIVNGIDFGYDVFLKSETNCIKLVVSKIKVGHNNSKRPMNPKDVLV